MIWKLLADGVWTDDERVFALHYQAAPAGRFLPVRGGHRLEQDREYQRAVRTAFFADGLHAPRTQALLDSPP